MPTTVPFGDSKAQQKWSANLFVDTVKKSYFDRKFVGTTDNHIIQRLTDLESDAGDTVNFDLAVQLRQKPVVGDARLEGKEEALRFYSDNIYIDQMRHSVSAGGKMTRQRTVHNMRQIANEKLSDYWSKYIDEMRFIYLSGARGINQDFTEDTAWTGHAANPIEAPDATHQMYGGDATQKSELHATEDKMTRAVIEKATTRAGMMRAVDPTTASMVPVKIAGEDRYVCIMSLYSEYDLRVSDTNGWLDIQKAAAGAEGRDNPIFKGGLGMIGPAVLHSHPSVIRFSDYGGGSVAAARALFMGRQAAVTAYGAGKGNTQRMSWKEEMHDYGNEPTVAAGTIMGVKKSRFNSKDFGVLAIDVAAAAP